MDDQPIQLVIQHFALPKYRVPVFRELANVPGIDLTLVYGKASAGRGPRGRAWQGL